tara:strand:+ start:1424 stop:2221 length:798 start_codon:yes stop_codon:yes gene_type:complete
MTKKYLVIGNPIDHSLSPELHNYWFKNNKIDAVYEKKEINKNEIEELITKIRKKEINGINVTVPFKNLVVPFLDRLTPEADITKSVNTISLENDGVVGYNTDIAGFELAIRYKKYDVNNKKILIIGAGGVVPSIIYSLKKMSPNKIFLMNRTKDKAENIKKQFKEIEILNWNQTYDMDMIINATSVGLNETEKLEIDLGKFGKNKFFYDVIYKPKETLFLKEAKKLGNQTENGKMMFIYQAHQAFFIWNKTLPKIDQEVINLVEI